MSAGLFACPQCNATLRVPAGATAVRCPQCKTVLDIDVPAPAAPPLPFGGPKPKPAPQSGKVTKAPPPPATSSGKHRASLVDEVAEEVEGRAREAAEKKAAARKVLRSQEAAEAEQEERYQELLVVCQRGRTALLVLRAGSFAYAMGVLLGAVAMLSLFLPLFGSTAGVIFPLGMAVAQIGTLLLGVGFGLALFGPTQGRFLVSLGLGVVVAQLIAMAVVIPVVAALLSKLATGVPEAATAAGYHMVGFITYFPLVADFPTRLVQGYPPVFLAVFIGALEYVRLVVLSQLLDVYSTHGKEVEIGFRAQQCASKVLSMIVLGGLFRLALSLLFDAAPPGEFQNVLGIILHIAILGALMGVAVFWLFTLTQIISDTSDVMTAVRYLSKEERLAT